MIDVLYAMKSSEDCCITKEVEKLRTKIINLSITRYWKQVGSSSFNKRKGLYLRNHEYCTLILYGQLLIVVYVIL